MHTQHTAKTAKDLRYAGIGTKYCKELGHIARARISEGTHDEDEEVYESETSRENLSQLFTSNSCGIVRTQGVCPRKQLDTEGQTGQCGQPEGK